MKKNFLLLIILLINIKCNDISIKVSHKNIDSLFALLEKTNDNLNKTKLLSKIKKSLSKLDYDTITRNEYIKLGNKYLDGNNYSEYIITNNLIEKKSLINKDTSGLINIYCNKAYYYLTQFKNDSSYYYLSKAEKLSKIKKHSKFLDFIYNSKASILILRKDYTNTELNATKAIFFSLKNHKYLITYNSYTIIGNSLSEQNKLNEALTYYNKALLTLKNVKNDINIKSYYGQIYNYIAGIYIKKKEYKKAEKILKIGLNQDDFKKHDQDIYCYLKNNLGQILLKKENENSKTLFLETLNISKNTKNYYAQTTSNLFLSEYYLQFRDLNNSKIYAEEALNISKSNNLPDDQLKALLLIAKADPKNAATYFENYKTLSDSLINAERQTRDKFARIEYETDEIINQKEAVQKENQIINQRFWSVITVTIIILLIVLILYLVKSRNIKQKELQFVQEQQEAKEEIYELMLNQQHRIEEGKYLEKRRVSQELHDGIMGKLTAIRLNLFVLKKRKDPETVEKCLPFIDDIQTIEKEIRQIAHDLNQNLFDDNVTFISIVENLFTLISNHSDTQFKLFVDERIDWDLIPNTTKINVYRIIQEALQNTEKYAKASLVTLNMKKEGENINITIEDNGVGFDSTIKKKGIGLENMENRMQEIHGTFTIESKIKKGTKINLLFPI